jgi:hypothetical protein
MDVRALQSLLESSAPAPGHTGNDVDDEYDGVEQRMGSSVVAPRAARERDGVAANNGSAFFPTVIKGAGGRVIDNNDDGDAADANNDDSSNDKTNGGDIWADGEAENGDDYDDGREAPDYEIIYKQKVTSEDIYLGMGDKTPGSASCESIIVRIEMPLASSVSELDLDVKPRWLLLRSPQYKLFVGSATSARCDVVSRA